MLVVEPTGKMFPLKALLEKLLGARATWNGAQYWRDRVRVHGRCSVLNLAHSARDFDKVTLEQKRLLLPILSRLLNGSERSVLDFGCGPGRFTPDLATLINGEALGVDISEELIAMAPNAEHVSYQTIPYGEMPSGNMRFDVVWICLVLGGIQEQTLTKTARAIEQSLTPSGLLFLVENTTAQKNVVHWTYRSPEQYQKLFPSVRLSTLASYLDVGQEITIMAGRRGC